MNRTKILSETRQILENGWCKFAGAKNRHSDVVAVESDEARSFCILGAIDRACARVCVSDKEQHIAFLDIMEYFRQANDIENVIHWNDEWDRTYEDVVTAINVAIHKSRWEKSHKTPVSLAPAEVTIA